MDFDVPTWADFVLLLLGAIGFFATAWAVYRGTKNKTYIEMVSQRVDLMATTNGELARTVDWERSERQREQLACKAETARLEGKLEAIQDGIVRDLVGEIKAALVDAIHETFSPEGYVDRRAVVAERTAPATGSGQAR